MTFVLLLTGMLRLNFVTSIVFGLIFDYMKKIKFTIMTSKNLLIVLFLACTLTVFAQEPDQSLIPYRQGDLWGYTTTDKSIAIKPQFDDAQFFHEGFAVVKKGSKYGYINKTGKVVIPIKYTVAKPFRFGFYEKAGAKAGDLNDQKAVL